MTEEEFMKKIHKLMDEYVRSPQEIQDKLDDEIVEKYHILINNLIFSDDFSKAKYFKLLDEFYNECVEILFSYKDKEE